MELRSANDLMQDYRDACTDEPPARQHEPRTRFVSVKVREVLSWNTSTKSLEEDLHDYAQEVLGEELNFEVELIGLGEDAEFLIYTI